GIIVWVLQLLGGHLIPAEAIFLRIWEPALLFGTLHFCEWFLTPDRRSESLAWAIVACIGSAALFELIYLPLMLADLKFTTFSLGLWSWAFVPVVSILFWPLMVVFAWLII